MTSLIDKQYEEILKRFKADIVPEILGNMQTLRINTSGKLRNSLQMHIDQTGESWTISFRMLISGAVIHKKERFAQKASAKDLAEWIRTKGLSVFKYVPGYEHSGTIPDDAAERIAWAIKKSRKRERFSTGGPMGYHTMALTYNGFPSWFYKPYFSRWKTARVELVDQYFSTTSDELSKEIAKSYEINLVA